QAGSRYPRPKTRWCARPRAPRAGCSHVSRDQGVRPPCQGCPLRLEQRRDEERVSFEFHRANITGLVSRARSQRSSCEARSHKPSGSAKTTVCSPRKHTNHTAAASAAAVPRLVLTHPLLALLHVVDPLLYPLLAALETLLAPLDLLLGAAGRRQAETDLLERLVHPLECRLAVAAVLVTGGLQVVAGRLEGLPRGVHVRVLLGAHHGHGEEAESHRDDQGLRHARLPITHGTGELEPFERATLPRYCSLTWR